MASIRAFLDTSGFYALLVRDEKVHGAAATWMEAASREHPMLATTDLVLSEHEC